MVLTGSSYAVAVGYYSIVTFLCAMFFGWARKSRVFGKFYSPRCYSTDPRHARPPELPYSWGLAWVLPVGAFNHLTIYKYGGMDGLAMLRTLYFGLQMMVWLLVLCCAILLPVNMTGGYVEELLKEPSNDVLLSNLDKMSMTNIAPNSNRLYAHAVVSYIITFIACTMLWHYNKVFVALRVLHLENQSQGDEAYCVLVQDVPGIVQGTKVQRGTGWLALCCVPRDKRRKLSEAGSRAIRRGVDSLSQAAYGFNRAVWCGTQPLAFAWG